MILITYTKNTKYHDPKSLYGDATVTSYIRKVFKDDDTDSIQSFLDSIQDYQNVSITKL